MLRGYEVQYASTCLSGVKIGVCPAAVEYGIHSYLPVKY